MSAPPLGPATLAALHAGVRRPGYDRASLGIGMAHVGMGAFHRCHQAEFTDDALEAAPGRWGVVGINLRPPRIAPTLGAQAGLYTRLLREGEQSEARVIGCVLAAIDAEDDPAPALRALAAPEIDVVTLTVTEKAYGHAPATGLLDPLHPDVAHDLSAPERPRSVPGLLARALELRRAAGAGPVTLVSCDNVPANGRLLAGVVGAMAARLGGGLEDWIAANVAFPSTMVDRIVPATTPEDMAEVERRFGYADAAVVVGEPFRDWAIEARFAGRTPPWERAGARFVEDVAPYELMKMRLLNAAQSALAYLGLLAGHDRTSEAAADPLLAAFVRRMLLTEAAPTLPPVPGVAPAAYVETTFARLANRAIRHRCHQIATDGSQKLPQRLVNPAAERLARGEPAPCLTIAIAAWMAYLILASRRFGRRWTVEDPEAARVAAIADAAGHDAPALVAGVLGLRTVFDPALAGRGAFRADLARALDALLGGPPAAVLREAEEGAAMEGRGT